MKVILIGLFSALIMALFVYDLVNQPETPETSSSKVSPEVSPEVSQSTTSPQQVDTPEVLGKKLYSQYACIGCHSLNGQRMTGPSFKNLFMLERELNNGEKIVADESYLKESVVAPNSKVLKGYAANMMPAYRGQFSEQELDAIVAFIKSIK